MENHTTMKRFIYWLYENELDAIKPDLITRGYKFGSAKLTPCETLSANAEKLIYAKPQLWSRLCVRQGSWYRQSSKAGKTLLVSEHKLPSIMDAYIDAELSQSDFSPKKFPSKKVMNEVVNSPAYRDNRPDEWERPSIKDGIMFKIFFSVTRFWNIGDNLSRHWLSHRANHANFLSKTVTTIIDGENVPYSISPNKGVCSSCVEFFNLTASDTRKLVNACPGAITFSSVKKDTYYDVKPIGIPIVTA
jgi:hypothetical protein